MAIIDFFDRGWRIAPSAIAYRTGPDASGRAGEAWTFDRAGTRSCRIAHALLAAGVGRGTAIAVLSPNDPAAWICVLGVWRAGATWVPLNPAHAVDDNVELMNRFDVEIVFYAPEYAREMAAARARLPRVRLWIALGDGVDDPDLDRWCSGYPDTRPEVPADPDDVVAIAPTGGTTGAPKGVMNTHRSFGTMIAHQLMAMTYPDGAPIVNLAAAPMTHTAGLFSLQASARGGTVVILRSANADGVLEAIERHGVTELFLPPTVVYRMLERLECREIDTSSLRYLMYAAAPMSVEKLRRGIARLGPVFLECYGQMEAPIGISFLRPDEHLAGDGVADDQRLSSCGRPYPLVTVEIRDPETGVELGPGRTGEICVRGDLVMKGYYKEPEKTEETLRNGWLHTGDLGHLDADGYLHLTDRRKDMIITGGFNVYPNEVEQVIWEHPAVRDCAVVGAPDEDWGEAVTAVVELQNGADVSPAELTSMCRNRLGPVRTPKRVMFVDALPRSANGKVLKRTIRDRLWADRDTRI